MRDDSARSTLQKRGTFSFYNKIRSADAFEMNFRIWRMKFLYGTEIAFKKVRTFPL